MTTVALTGAQGFLGWHVRLRHFSRSGEDTLRIGLGERYQPQASAEALDASDRLIHLAGVNRGTDQEVHAGNVQMARQLASALRNAQHPPSTVVFANSIQAGNGSVYGTAKQQAATELATVCRELGLTFVDLQLPNLFGEHGRPFYNSVVATFSHLIALGEPVEVKEDRELELMHAQTAASAVLDATEAGQIADYRTRRILVSAVAEKLTGFQHLYQDGQIPDLTDPFDRDLFNTFRSYSFMHRPTIALEPKTDTRGQLVETVKSHGGEGQTFFSTTRPGVIRGQHFHLRKIERFAVLSGTARLGIRKMFTGEVIDLEVAGDTPCAVDMPIGWVHNLRNEHDTADVLTQFWTNEVFNPDDTDTFYQEV
ncbi:NAD-dependent epimerase/dehydratase family protein [Micrococcus terreus]|uniref:polysaccharide biosynthesis C-terminal domain-containing protein n=1 Tax=Micrococcus terreus TaxID=574650 RepID=UPI0033EB2E5E